MSEIFYIQDVHHTAEYLTYKKKFRWNTMDRQTLKIDQMETSHVFNSLKMLYNHMTAELDLEPVWFVHHYQDVTELLFDIPETYTKSILFFIATIEYRQDLPPKYAEPYLQIKHNLIAYSQRKVNRNCVHGFIG